MNVTQTVEQDPLVRLQDTEISIAPSVRSHLLKREMPGLDILRGLAVLAVVADHGFLLLPQSWSGLPVDATAHRLEHITHSGWLGVNLFFILSGFLITGMLIDTRNSQTYWRNFYVRRLLRILPLLIVVLISLRVLIPINWLYFAMCLFYMANLAEYVPSSGLRYDPLWTLAVEEQFYLVWPFVVRRLSLRNLGFLCTAILVLSPVLRGLSVSSWRWLGDPYTATWLVSDNLAWGALIAIWLRSAETSILKVRSLTLLGFAGGLACLAAFSSLHWMSRTTPLGAAFEYLPFQLLFVAALLLALQFGDRPAVLKISAPLRFYGYISYGLYLIHLLVFATIDRYFPGAAPQRITLWVATYRFLIALLAATLIGFLSRHYFEAAFLRLKSKLAPARQV